MDADVVTSGPSTFHSTLVMGIFASGAVLLRYLAKVETKSGLAADDYGIAMSLITYWAYAGVIFWGIFAGGGGLDMHKLVEGDKAGATIYFKSMLISACVYITAATTVKVALILFYRKIFHVHALFKRCTFIVGILCICLWITCVIGISLYCIPLKKLWNPSIEGRCVDWGTFYLSATIIELLINVVLLCLPLWVISTLRLPIKQQVGVTFIILLGGFVCVTAIIRIKVVYVPGSRTIAFSKGVMWGSIHLGTGIICACLPTLRPLWTKLSVLPSSFSTTLRQRLGFGSGGSQSKFHRTIYQTKPTENMNMSDPFHYGGGQVANDRIRLVEAVGGVKATEGFEAFDDQPPNSIAVRSYIHVV